MTTEHPIDAWIKAIPNNPYDPCPCGCGTKWRYVVRAGDEELEKHEAAFVKRMQEESSP